MTNIYSATSQFAALADPTRMLLMGRLAKRPLLAGEVAEGLSITRPAVSQHLKVLLDAGLVTVRPQGTKRIYAINGKAIVAMRSYLDKLWDESLQNFKRAAERK